MNNAITPTFLRFTCGLRVRLKGYRAPLLAAVEFQRIGDHVRMLLVSGHNLDALPGVAVKQITAIDYENRPQHPYDSLVEARWAFGLLDAEICFDN